jgi:hypothetical protein
VLFVLVLLAHERRRIIHVNITEHPTAAWTAQQMVEAFPDDTAPRWLLRDRDAIFGDVFRRRVAGMSIAEVVSSPSSPAQNPYAERLIGSIRRECLDHVIVFGEWHLRRLLTASLTYYDRARTHLASEKDAPTTRRVQTSREGPWSRSRKLADCIIATNEAQPDGHGRWSTRCCVSRRVSAERPCVSVPRRFKAIASPRHPLGRHRRRRATVLAMDRGARGDRKSQIKPPGWRIESHNRREGSSRLVNGRQEPEVAIAAGQIERWRIVNAARARYVRLSIGDRPFRILGTDGGLITSPVSASEVLLAPADRVDLAIGPFAEGELLQVDSLRYYRGKFGIPRRERFATLRVGPAARSQAMIPDVVRRIEPLVSRPVTPNREVNLGWKLSPRHDGFRDQ